MDGKESRAFAKAQIKGRRGFLLGATLLTVAPAVIALVVFRLLGMQQPVWCSFFIAILSSLLTFGSQKLALEQTEGERKSFRGMLFFLWDGLLWKALLLAFTLWVISFATAFVPNKLLPYGAELMQSASTVVEKGYSVITDTALYQRGRTFATLGTVLVFVVAFVKELLLFPVRYSFSLNPREPLKKHVLDGAGLALRRIDAICVFLFWLYLPIAAGVFGFVVIFFILRASLLLVPLLMLCICAIGMLLWYIPQCELAQAAFTKSLILSDRQEPMPPRVKKRMKLQRKSDYYKVRMSDGKAMKK